MVSPLDDSTHSPPMNCLCWVTETLTADLRSVKSGVSVTPCKNADNCKQRLAADAPDRAVRYNWAAVRILVIGTGGVGSAFAAIAQRRSFFERIVLADLDPSRPQAVVDRLGEHDRFGSAGLDASDEDAIVGLIADVKADAVLNATDPRFNPQIFDACLRARVTYLDMAMTLSEPHPTHPHEETHVKLGDYQFAQEENWKQEDLLALVGIGIEPGAADVFARHAADELFSEIDEVGIRDGANLVIEGYDFAPTFSIWTTIEECLNPPVIWERGRGWFTTRAVLGAGGVRLPGGHRPRSSA